MWRERSTSTARCLVWGDAAGAQSAQATTKKIAEVSGLHLQPAEVRELLLRQAGDDADGAVDGAEEHGGDLGGLTVGQLHDQAAVAEAVHELAQVELPDRLPTQQGRQGKRENQ